MEATVKSRQDSFAPNIPNNEEVCSVCGVKTLRTIELMGIKRTFRVMCKCKQREQEEEKNRQEKLDKMRKIENLKKLSLLGERYKNATFEHSIIGKNPTFDRAFNRCRKYCELYEKTVKGGYGIYIFGDKGVGKTHLTACMANDLMTNCVPVLFTSLFEVSKAVKSTFNRESSFTEQNLIERFANIDVLFFDDLGTEIFSKNSGDTWLQSLLFDIINKRYNNKKATIFSSNHSLNALINECGIAGKTVDRISEMTSGAVMKIEGMSLRSIKKDCIF